MNGLTVRALLYGLLIHSQNLVDDIYGLTNGAFSADRRLRLEEERADDVLDGVRIEASLADR